VAFQLTAEGPVFRNEKQPSQILFFHFILTHKKGKIAKLVKGICLGFVRLAA
jgi:hypothetical protein